MHSSNFFRVIEEITKTLNNVNQSEINQFEQILIDTKLKRKCKIVGVGAGRVGMAVKGFMMRLGHMGYDSWFIGDTTVPSIASNDILIVGSGSGETKTIVELVKIARKNGCTILCVTGDECSTISSLSNYIIKLDASSATKIGTYGEKSEQPMTTLNEQCMSILFDIIVLDLMQVQNETHETMWARHSNLE